MLPRIVKHPNRLDIAPCIGLYTGCIKMIGAFQSAITALKTHAEVSFPHGTKQQVFKFCAHAQSREHT